MMSRAAVLLAGIAGAGIHVVLAAEPEIACVPHPPAEGLGVSAVWNRPPLAPDRLGKLPIGAIEPRGWLRAQLELMRDGMTGRLPEVSPWCNPEGNAWLARDGEGKHPWEEVPYWLKGLGDLGYTLKDEPTMALAARWLEGVMNTQRPDGYLGPEANRRNRDVWPNMPMLSALQSLHEATGDPRVIEVLTRYFKWQASLSLDELMPRGPYLDHSWQNVRAGDNIASIHWLYNRIGEPWLLELGSKLHEGALRWDEGIASWHGVNICQGYREPAVFWAQSHEPAHLAAAERNYQEAIARYGQAPGGMFGADENAREGYDDPRQAAETCSMVEFMNSFEILLRLTGDPVQADRCEDVAFNSLPAAFTPDYKGLHYLTAPNMPQLDKENKAPGLQNPGTMLSYDPADYRCCQHNHAMGWPYFAEHLWLATRDSGLAAAMYAECRVSAKVGDGATATITEETAYPFDSAVLLRVAMDRPARFPMYLRIPGWCPGARVSVNGRDEGVALAPGTFARIEREWADGDAVELVLPMETEVRHWTRNKNAVSVHRGPLAYSLRIGERWVRYGGTDRWPAMEVFPTTEWNYGLVIDAQRPETSFGVLSRSGPVERQPWTPEAAPVALTALAKRIPGWTLDKRGLVGELSPGPIRSDEPVGQVVLIPMGCARLRISSFPLISDGPEAREWVVPPPPIHEGSWEEGDLKAPSDGALPASSADPSTPRFTWWPRRGTEEWLSWRFEATRTVSGCGVYWFDDTGSGLCRVPESWRVQYRDGEEWRDAAGASAAGVEKDRFNEVAFEPVRTAELRIVVRLREGMSGGVLEWVVR